jgi:hypothetical protein
MCVTDFITCVTDFITYVTGFITYVMRKQIAEKALLLAGLVSGWFTWRLPEILGAEAAEERLQDLRFKI